MPAPLVGSYRDLYAAGLERLRQNEARRKALALQGAARAGVNTSGVGLIPIESINREAAQQEAQLGAELSGQQHQEEYNKEQAETAFNRQKELIQFNADIAEAAAARQRARERKAAKAGLWSDVIGGLAGGAISYFTKNKKKTTEEEY